MHRLYVHTKPFYIRNLSIHGFWYPCGGEFLEPNPPWILRDKFMSFLNSLEFNSAWPMVDSQ